MLNRLKWIAVSYVTRPMVLTVAGLAAFFFIMSLISSRHPSRLSNLPEAPLGPLVIRSESQLNDVRASGRQKDVTAVYLSSLWYDQSRNKMQRQGAVDATSFKTSFKPPPADFYRVLEEFPHLRALEYTCFVSPTGFDRVLERTEVEYLELGGGCELDMGQLVHFKNLRRLALNIRPRRIDRLADLPKLEMIVFQSTRALNDTVLEELAKLPHLKTLVFQFYYSHPAQPRLSPTALAALRRAPLLETIYVGGFQTEGPDELVGMVREALPEVAIAPVVAPSNGFDFWMRFIWFLFLASIVGFQLSSQYRSPASRLTPGFGAAHAGFGAALAVIIVTLATLNFVTQGAEPSSALALSSALVSSLICMLVSTWRGSTPVRGLQRLIGIPSLLFLGLMGALLMPTVVDRVLSQNDPVIVTTLALMTTTSIVVTGFVLHNLVAWVPEGSDIITSWRPSQGLQVRQGWLAAMPQREQQLEELIQADRNWNWWARVQRWRWGNPPFRYFRFALVMVATTLLFQLPLRPAVGLDHRFARALLFMLALFGCFGISSQVAMIWRGRLLVLPLEILRPFPRRTIQRELMAALLVDLVPPVFIGAIAAVTASSLNPDFSIQWRSVPWAFLLWFAAGPILTAAAAGTLIVVRRYWLAIGICIVTVEAVVAAVALLTLAYGWMANWPTSGEMPGAIEAQLWLPMLVGAVLCYLMGRRWLRMEIG